jgi:hypothetical protein
MYTVFNDYSTYFHLVKHPPKNATPADQAEYRRLFEEAAIGVLKAVGVDLVTTTASSTAIRTKHKPAVSLATALADSGIVQKATDMASALAKSGVIKSTTNAASAWPFPTGAKPAPSAPVNVAPGEGDAGRAPRVAAYINVTKTIARNYKSNGKTGSYRVRAVTNMNGKTFIKVASSKWIPLTPEIKLHNGRSGARWHLFSEKQL